MFLAKLFMEFIKSYQGTNLSQFIVKKVLSSVIFLKLSIFFLLSIENFIIRFCLTFF